MALHEQHAVLTQLDNALGALGLGGRSTPEWVDQLRTDAATETATAGAKTGSAVLAFTSNGTGTSGLGLTALALTVLGRGVAARAVGLGLAAGLCLLCGYLRAPYFTLPFNLATWAVLAATAGARRG